MIVSTLPRGRCRRSVGIRLRRGLQLVACLAAGATLAGCFTGDRPSFEDEQPAEPITSTGNPDIDEVLGLLDSVAASEFTATYAIETRFGALSSSGVVVQAPGRRLSVTVENDERAVRFVIDGAEERTCDLLANECETSLNNARISDTQLGYDFYAPAIAKRLRADADRQVDDPFAYTKGIGGESASCVDIAVSGGTKTYCALDSGAVAEFVGADVTIELLGFSRMADESAFESSR
ncbi:MAG: hypothetical protein AB8G26_17785 [Ilumatobacter sp.]